MIEKILNDMETAYGFAARAVSPIKGGYMNRLWRVITDGGDLLIKQYSLERYSQKQIENIEAALQRQIRLAEMGIPCPHIYCCGGRAVRWLDDQAVYTVMDFREGQNESAETITLSQMEDLGRVCARIHAAFGKLPVEAAPECDGRSVKGYPIDAGKLQDSLWEHYQNSLQALRPEDPAVYREAVLAMAAPLHWLQENSADFFERLPQGIAHEDFTPDNLLFSLDSVAAVIDFDRNIYSFLWHDIGRAILSFALEEEGPTGFRFNKSKIEAFVRGYGQILSFTMADVPDALRITWCIEAPWWIQRRCFLEDQGKARRYRDEVVWIMGLDWDIDIIS